MRIFLVVILVVIVAVGGIYTVCWHKLADQFKEGVIASIDSVNTNAKPMTKDLSLVRYESVTITGFPFDMVVEVNKPVLDIPVSTLMAQAAQQAQPAPTAPAFEWVEEISYSDKVTFTRNVMGDRYTFSTYGERTNKSLINHAARHTLVSASSSPLVCHLGVERPSGSMPWTLQPIPSDPDAFIAIFRSADCSADGISLKDTAGNAPLATADGFSFTISNTNASGNNRQVALKADVSKFKATPDFDKVMGDYVLMTDSLTGKADQMLPPQAFSAYGEQNLKADATYEGPVDKQYFADPNAHFHFDVNTLDVASAAGQFALNAHIASVPEGNDRSMSISIHEKGVATELGDQLSQKRFTDILTSLQKAPAQTDPAMQLFQKAAALGTPAATVAKVFPQIHTLGDVAFDFDLNVKGPNQEGALFKKGTVKLDDFDITATPYGIKMKGTASNASSANATGSAPAHAPTGDLTVTCISCDALVNDLGNYAMRLESVFDQIQQRPPFLSKELIDASRQFLHGIAEDGNAKDLVIHFVMNDSNVTVSGKQIPEVLALYMTTIAPRLPQSPSAGQPVPHPVPVQ